MNYSHSRRAKSTYRRNEQQRFDLVMNKQIPKEEEFLERINESFELIQTDEGLFLSCNKLFEIS